VHVTAPKHETLLWRTVSSCKRALWSQCYLDASTYGNALGMQVHNMQCSDCSGNSCTVPDMQWQRRLQHVQQPGMAVPAGAIFQTLTEAAACCSTTCAMQSVQLQDNKS
jgi:hypothetical protein